MENDYPPSIVRLPPSETATTCCRCRRSAVVDRHALSHNCADIKGVGVDCLGMLLVRVFVDLNLCPPFDPRPYPVDWHFQVAAKSASRLHLRSGAETRRSRSPGRRDGVPLWLLLLARRHRHRGSAAAHRSRLLPGPNGHFPEDEVLRNAVLADPARQAAFFQRLGQDIMSAGP